MTKNQRALYFNKLWPDACKHQGWDRNDKQKRKEVTFQATRKESSAKLDQHQITALFAYLGYLAGDPVASDAWYKIQHNGAEAVNYQRIGEYHRKRAGYRDGGKIDMERFRKMGDEQISPDMTEEEAKQYAMTMRARAKRKLEIDEVGIWQDPK